MGQSVVLSGDKKEEKHVFPVLRLLTTMVWISDPKGPCVKGLITGS